MLAVVGSDGASLRQRNDGIAIDEWRSPRLRVPQEDDERQERIGRARKGRKTDRAQALIAHPAQPREPALDGRRVRPAQHEPLPNILIGHRLPRRVLRRAGEQPDDGKQELERIDSGLSNVRDATRQRLPPRPMCRQEREDSRRDVPQNRRRGSRRRYPPVLPRARDDDAVGLTADPERWVEAAPADPCDEEPMERRPLLRTRQRPEELGDEVVDRTGGGCAVHREGLRDVRRGRVRQPPYETGAQPEQFAEAPAVDGSECTLARRDVGRSVLDCEELLQLAQGWLPSAGVGLGVVGGGAGPDDAAPAAVPVLREQPLERGRTIPGRSRTPDPYREQSIDAADIEGRG